ncbi:hypothetical protein N656DRAFT_774559 [Canariomyces notabilis]|uniref:Secreted protein n=1 Tax=Canariomyces notabilis TaxID=2074819 RepID=A0AAN6TKS2_9PEZI|nr:hypothetical protein N656DRAFT_774559 [Canariomyces arenarius]
MHTTALRWVLFASGLVSSTGVRHASAQLTILPTQTWPAADDDGEMGQREVFEQRCGCTTQLLD